MLSITLAEYDRNVAGVRETLGEEAFAIAWARGQALTLEQAVTYAREKTVALDAVRG